MCQACLLAIAARKPRLQKRLGHMAALIHGRSRPMLWMACCPLGCGNQLQKLCRNFWDRKWFSPTTFLQVKIRQQKLFLCGFTANAFMVAPQFRNLSERFKVLSTYLQYDILHERSLTVAKGIYYGIVCCDRYVIMHQCSSGYECLHDL